MEIKAIYTHIYYTRSQLSQYAIVFYVEKFHYTYVDIILYNIHKHTFGTNKTVRNRVASTSKPMPNSPA